MEKPAEPARMGPRSQIPTGGVALSEERLKLLAAQWEATYRSFRQMDVLDLGET